MVGCCAVNCSNQSSKGFRLFLFPTDPVRRAEWLRNCHREGWNPTPYSRLCEVHFEESQWENNRQDGWIKLKPNAVPTIFNASNPRKHFSHQRKSVYKNMSESSLKGSIRKKRIRYRQDVEQILPTRYKITIERINGDEGPQEPLSQETLERVLRELDIENSVSAFTVEFCRCGQSTKRKSMIINMQSQQTSSGTAVTVSELQKLKFSRRNILETVFIKQRGRPLPDISILQPGISKNKKYVRSFNTEWYESKSWLCGCEVRNALFCFPCLIFGGDTKWTESGFVNICKLKEKTEKHETSRKHIENAISLALLGTVNIDQGFGAAYRNSIVEHNKKVAKNREILSKLIDCILFCGNYQIPLCKQDEKDGSTNSNLFKELINFMFKLDTDLKNDLETSKVFKGIFKSIQNEILDCIFQVYQNKIAEDIREASFVAVMVEDLTDICETSQVVIVLRYLLKEEIFEHLWGFFIPESQTADALSKCILEQLNIILQGNEHKLVAQTFDGVNFMNGKKKVVDAIKKVYRNAHFIHSYTHEINLIMKNAASVTQNSRIFYANIMTISTFFSKSSKHVAIFHRHVKTIMQRMSTAQLNFNVHIINRVYENLRPLKSCLEEILASSKVSQTISETIGILMFIDDEKFIFWLELFYQIIPHLETLYIKMQMPENNIFKLLEYVADFKSNILQIRNSKYCENFSSILSAESKAVCDCIYADMEERYSFTNHLIAAELFNKNNFACYKKQHPINEIISVNEAYPMIYKENLETELKVFYERSDMHSYRTLVGLLKFITDNKLDSIVCKITTLIKILLTIPMPSSEPERCFSTLNTIKTFLKSTLNQDRLNARAVISTEKKFFSTYSDIKEKVIDLFSQNNARRVDFLFK